MDGAVLVMLSVGKGRWKGIVRVRLALSESFLCGVWYLAKCGWECVLMEYLARRHVGARVGSVVMW